LSRKDFTIESQKEEIRRTTDALAETLEMLGQAENKIQILESRNSDKTSKQLLENIQLVDKYKRLLQEASFQLRALENNVTELTEENKNLKTNLKHSLTGLHYKEWDSFFYSGPNFHFFYRLLELNLTIY
jgi:chromosome segregation ATPase